MTTKRDFLNALTNPTHAEAVVKLRTLRKELREMNWKLKYRYYKKDHTFYMKLTPNAMSTASQAIAIRLLTPLDKIKNGNLDVSSHERNGEVYADLWIGMAGGFLV